MVNQQVGEPLARLRGRAREVLAQRPDASDDDLLLAVYGARVPDALKARLLATVVGDLREVAAHQAASPGPTNAESLAEVAWTVLAVLPAGPRPARHGLLALAAYHVQGGEVVGQMVADFAAADPRAPRYTGRAVDEDLLDLGGEDDRVAFGDVAADLLAFLGQRPICAQEAGLTWAFVQRELERVNLAAPAVPLVSLEPLARRYLPLRGKPTLAAIAMACGGAEPRRGDVRGGARLVSQALHAALEAATRSGVATLGDLLATLDQPSAAAAEQTILRRTSTAAALPSTPGVYVLRDEADEALYVGKAARLRERLTAYTSRPLGLTRRLEGLADQVVRLDAETYASDLLALLAEDHRIRELAPRYNTQRQVHRRGAWLRLKPAPPVSTRKRQPVLPRLELAVAPDLDQARHLGPFRNPDVAAGARTLANTLFDLKTQRSEAPREVYLAALEDAWRFLNGDSERGVEVARAQMGAAVAAHDHEGTRRWRRLLADARNYDPATLLLPADPRTSTYVVLRLTDDGLEGFRIVSGLLMAHVHHSIGLLEQFVVELLEPSEPATSDEDAELVLRWLGWQRPPAQLVYLPAEEETAGQAERVLAACHALLDQATSWAFAPDQYA